MNFGLKEITGVLCLTMKILWWSCGGEVKGLGLKERDMVDQCKSEIQSHILDLHGFQRSFSFSLKL